MSKYLSQEEIQEIIAGEDSDFVESEVKTDFSRVESKTDESVDGDILHLQISVM